MFQTMKFKKHIYKEVWRPVAGQRTMHAPSIEALSLLTSMRLSVNVLLLTKCAY